MLQSGACANCDRAIASPEQKFCPACGQATPAHRINWHFLGHELEHSVLHMDRGIFYSIKELMLRPGHLMRDYIQGRRGNQVKPLLLLMISAAVVVLLTKYLLGGDLIGSSMQAGAGYVEGAGAGLDGGATAAASARAAVAVKDWINAHLTAFTLLLLPFQAGAFWLAFKGRGLNYPEWLVISALLTVQTFIFTTAAVLVQRWLPSAQAWVVPLAFFYLVFSLVQYFQGSPRWKTALRALLGFTLFMVVSFLVSAAATPVLLFVLMRG